MHLARCYLSATLWSEMPSQWVLRFRVRSWISGGLADVSCAISSPQVNALDLVRQLIRHCIEPYTNVKQLLMHIKRQRPPSFYSEAFVFSNESGTMLCFRDLVVRDVFVVGRQFACSE